MLFSLLFFCAKIQIWIPESIFRIPIPILFYRSKLPPFYLEPCYQENCWGQHFWQIDKIWPMLFCPLKKDKIGSKVITLHKVRPPAAQGGGGLKWGVWQTPHHRNKGYLRTENEESHHYSQNSNSKISYIIWNSYYRTAHLDWPELPTARFEAPTAQ